MFNAVAVDTLSTIESVPILISQLFAVESRPRVRITHFWYNSIDAHLHFVVLLKVFCHPVIVEDAFSWSHYSVFKSEILHCERTAKQNNQTKSFRAETERFMPVFYVFTSL